MLNFLLEVMLVQVCNEVYWEIVSREIMLRLNILGVRQKLLRITLNSNLFLSWNCVGIYNWMLVGRLV
jgi:hypothetical protein